jgi:hypothetical protein
LASFGEVTAAKAEQTKAVKETTVKTIKQFLSNRIFLPPKNDNWLNTPHPLIANYQSPNYQPV